MQNTQDNSVSCEYQQQQQTVQPTKQADNLPRESVLTPETSSQLRSFLLILKVILLELFVFIAFTFTVIPLELFVFLTFNSYLLSIAIGLVAFYWWIYSRTVRWKKF